MQALLFQPSANQAMGPMPSDGSVTHWIRQLKAGNHEAAQRLWEGYFRRLVSLARSKLQGARQGVADEEDVALSAFDSFCRGLEQGRFPLLNDANDLWRLLVVITARKALRLRRHEGRQKRGGGKRADLETFLKPADASDSPGGWEEVVGPEPTPEFAAQVAEEYQGLLDRLGDEQLRRVAQWKMEGYTSEEIAEKLGCVTRTVERKLQVIRTLWTRDLSP